MGIPTQRSSVGSTVFQNEATDWLPLLHSALSASVETCGTLCLKSTTVKDITQFCAVIPGNPGRDGTLDMGIANHSTERSFTVTPILADDKVCHFIEIGAFSIDNHQSGA